MTNKELETIVDKLENRVRELERLQEVKEVRESETKDDKDKRILDLEKENEQLKLEIKMLRFNYEY